MNGYGRGFFGLPPVVKNIIMLNVIMLLADYAAYKVFGVNLNMVLGLYFPKSEHFMPIQILTHMFMHGGFWHIFFNMYALFIFGGVLENTWGPKRFLIYYLVCGIGAAVTHETVIAFQYHNIVTKLDSESLRFALEKAQEYFYPGINAEEITDPYVAKLILLLNTPTVGASGAIFGVLLAFGVLFPNTQLMLLFPPMPIKAKYFVMAYGAIELWMAITQSGGNIAHTAHLGGMLFGYILIRYWRRTTNTFY
ncbi:MAG TPA: rhomboid family intramembrane serine protease [Bacteroidales bacterium]|jgi:membrane associated rhomboid family serine protease|nr:rhomboid family intramembrane serine protease [Bacteroidales bacterium]